MKVSDKAGATLNSTVSVSGNPQDPNPANSSATGSTPVTGKR
jgi:hypothetical protein